MYLWLDTNTQKILIEGVLLSKQVFRVSLLVQEKTIKWEGEGEGEWKGRPGQSKWTKGRKKIHVQLFIHLHWTPNFHPVPRPLWQKIGHCPFYVACCPSDQPHSASKHTCGLSPPESSCVGWNQESWEGSCQSNNFSPAELSLPTSI